MVFDPDALLEALLRRPIILVPIDTPLPRRRSFGDMTAYNGFTRKERLRTFGVAKWLASLAAMQFSAVCDICGREAPGQHAEDYYDLGTWMDICIRCHGRLHKRFNAPYLWQDLLGLLSLPQGHWAYRISPEPFDLATLLRERGRTEPTYADFQRV